MSFRKDLSLDQLARIGNVAQFISFPPQGSRDIEQVSRIAGLTPNHAFPTTVEALTCLLSASPEGTINVRSFTPDSPRSRDFHYGIAKLEEAVGLVDKLTFEGLFVIANETVDVADGGVSGVIQGDVIEFAPDDTPRCVEKEGAASLPRKLGLSVLKCVYGFSPDIVDVKKGRLEFSIHPKPRGWKKTHTLMWEYEGSANPPSGASFVWPNRFSRHIGDKAFGLVIADVIGLLVPRTTVLARRVAPFSFGQSTGSMETWTRTCPAEQEPGLFTTAKGWLDPFKLLSAEDPKALAIPSVLAQSAINAVFSGATITDRHGNPIIEGTRGDGNRLMLGQRNPEPLPKKISADVQKMYCDIVSAIGAVGFEWVHDGKRVWIVQLHQGKTNTTATTLVPGEPTKWVVFKASRGLEELRLFLAGLPADIGVQIDGEIGLTSHLADLLRKTNRPARLSSPNRVAA